MRRQLIMQVQITQTTQATSFHYLCSTEKEEKLLIDYFTSFLDRSCCDEVTMDGRLNVTTRFCHTMFPFLFLRMELWER
jgi:hypothetical protein